MVPSVLPSSKTWKWLTPAIWWNSIHSRKYKASFFSRTQIASETLLVLLSPVSLLIAACSKCGGRNGSGVLDSYNKKKKVKLLPWYQLVYLLGKVMLQGRLPLPKVCPSSSSCGARQSTLTWEILQQAPKRYTAAREEFAFEGIAESERFDTMIGACYANELLWCP